MIKVDLKDWRRLLRDIRFRWSKKNIAKRALVGVAHFLLNAAVKAPIPRDGGDLAASRTVQLLVSRSEVKFGFNSAYAAFQDAGRQSFQVVRPKRKRALYIPLTERGKRLHQY